MAFCLFYWTYMHEKKSCDKAEALAVSNLRVEERVGLENVKEGELTWAKGDAEIGMIGECPT